MPVSKRKSGTPRLQVRPGVLGFSPPGGKQTRERVRIHGVGNDSANEVGKLRAEVERLRRDLDHVLRAIGQEQDLADEPRTEFLTLDAEIIGVRRDRETLPIVLKAHDGYACIYLNDDKGRTRGLFEVDEDGSARFEIWNKEGQVVAAIGETGEGGGEIFVAGADGKPRAVIKGNEAGGTISAQNGEGHVQALMLAKENGGTFVATNAHGTPMAEMFGDETGGTVHIKEPTGRSMAYMSASADRGIVSVFNEFGDQAAALASDDEGGAVVLFDAEGKIKPNPG
jgi:hypothetical protein